MACDAGAAPCAGGQVDVSASAAATADVCARVAFRRRARTACDADAARCGGCVDVPVSVAAAVGAQASFLPRARAARDSDDEEGTDLENPACRRAACGPRARRRRTPGRRRRRRSFGTCRRCGACPWATTGFRAVIERSAVPASHRAASRCAASVLVARQGDDRDTAEDHRHADDVQRVHAFVREPGAEQHGHRRIDVGIARRERRPHRA